jgi:hypothetical protein
MFDFLFPIFCFGLVVTGIVAKGLLAAADFAEAQKTLDGSVNAESGGGRISNRSVSFFTRPDESRPDRFSQSLNNHAVSEVVQGTTPELK